MANDPRSFTVKDCYADPHRVEAVGRKKRFLDNITKVGDLEILNEGFVGGSSVAEGLRVLSSVSDSVRVGSSVVPGREGNETYNTTLGRVANTALDAVSEGTQVVMDTVGLGTAVETVGKLNPGVANRAWAQGQDIWDRVKRGRFDITDIPEVFSDLQNLETLTRNIFPGFGDDQKKSAARELCGATPYAMDLIAFAPKFQFLFIIEIHYSPAYEKWKETASQVAFVIKTSTRPRFNVDYEDVNMYGFRTRVVRRVDYQPMEMEFYDDNKNAAHRFYVSYMRAMSPIANWKNGTSQDGQYEKNGMNYDRGPSSSTFTETDPSTLGHSASSGPLFGSSTSILREIKLHHIYDYGNKMNTYHFYNPRITSFSPSDLTMLETGEGCSYGFEFMYDGVYIDHMIDLTKQTKLLKQLTSRHGFRYIDPAYDPTNTPGEGEPDAETAEATAPEGGFLGGFSEGLNAAADGITDAFGNIIGGVSNAAGQFTNSVNSVLADAESSFTNVTKGLTGAINQGIGIAQRAIGGLGDTISDAFKSQATLDAEAKAIQDTYNEENLLS